MKTTPGGPLLGLPGASCFAGDALCDPQDAPGVITSVLGKLALPGFVFGGPAETVGFEGGADIFTIQPIYTVLCNRYTKNMGFVFLFEADR